MKTEGVCVYSITSKGVDTSAPTLGAAVSKALTHASRIQLAGELEDGDVQSIYVRKLDDERVVGRIDIKHDIIEAFVTAVNP